MIHAHSCTVLSRVQNWQFGWLLKAKRTPQDTSKENISRGRKMRSCKYHYDNTTFQNTWAVLWSILMREKVASAGYFWAKIWQNYREAMEECNNGLWLWRHGMNYWIKMGQTWASQAQCKQHHFNIMWTVLDLERESRNKRTRT